MNGKIKTRGRDPWHILASSRTEETLSSENPLGLYDMATKSNKSFSNKILSPKSIGKKLRRRGHRSEDVSMDLGKSGFDLDSIPLDALGKLSIGGSVGQPRPKVVIAIDFGTTYSGYAYSLSGSQDEIHLMRRAEAGQFGVTTHKIPTILLLSERGGFHSFGYEAREAYHDLDEAESKKWLYFEKFKMELHSRKELSRRMELEASNGQRMLASLVFGHALRYFKDCCLKEINEGLMSQAPISTEDVQWVITVPAIWRQSAKQFMRHAATQAGLVSVDNPKQLIIALEPEAASIYCRKLRLRECIPDPHGTPPSSQTPSPSTGAPKYTSVASLPTATALSTLTVRHSTSTDCILQTGTSNSYAAEFNYGMRYLVADCGGGTVDLTVHELEDKGKLKELYKATGGAWGSMGVDCQFEMILVDIFGEDFLVDFVQSKPISWLELVSLFEAKKRAFSPHKQLSVNISLPFAFIEHYREFTGKSVESAVREYGESGIQWSSQGMLRLQPSVMMSLFEPVVSAIIHHIHDLLQIPDLSNIEYLFLVGGFAESQVLQDAVRNAFRSQIRVIIPQDVSLTILRGAVMFGHDPTLVHIRRSVLTYGVGCLNKFIPGKHPPEKRVVKDGSEWCTDIFDAFVFNDQAVSLGRSITRSYSPAQAGQQSTVITLFASEKDSVHYVTDPGCSKVGELRLEMPDTTGGKCRELRMSMIFGDTEITVEAVDLTSGQTAHASLDFLNK